MSFYGKAVRFTENGKEFDAFVVHEHELFPEAHGQSGQPLVHLVIADPAKESLNLADMHAKLILRLDVAHASQRFSDEWKKKHPDQQVWPGGRWSEYSTSPIEILKQVQDADAAKQEADNANAAKAAQAQASAQSVDDELNAVNAQIAEAEKKQQLENAKKKLEALKAGGEKVN